MKKKLKALIQDARLQGNTAFEDLKKAYLSAQNAVAKAKAKKAKAKTAYRDAAAEDGKKNHPSLLELRTAFRQAKYMQQYYRAALDLAEYRLSLWLADWLGQQPEAEGEAPAKPKKSAEKGHGSEGLSPRKKHDAE
jgi:hypothetical protein